jgi:hypothetical protein
MPATQARMLVHPIRNEAIAVDAREQILRRAIAMKAAREAAEQQQDQEQISRCVHRQSASI